MKKIVIAGGSGFLGSALASHFAAAGANVVILTRKPVAHAAGTQVQWDGVHTGPWAQCLNGADAVINLAGSTISRRHSREYRNTILQSRLLPTRAIGQALKQCSQPPPLWLNASGINIYACGNSPNDEKAPASGTGFLAEVCRQWEQAALEAVVPPTRLILLRTAVVLGKGSQSILTPLARLARWGLAGPAGSGRQRLAWIHLDDYVQAVAFIVQQSTWSGPVNLVAPEQVTNRDLMKEIRAAVHCPVGLPAPSLAVRLAGWLLNQEAGLLLHSTCAIPALLLQAGFVFRYPTVRTALAHLLPR